MRARLEIRSRLLQLLLESQPVPDFSSLLFSSFALFALFFIAAQQVRRSYAHSYSYCMCTADARVDVRRGRAGGQLRRSRHFDRERAAASRTARHCGHRRRCAHSLHMHTVLIPIATRFRPNPSQTLNMFTIPFKIKYTPKPQKNFKMILQKILNIPSKPSMRANEPFPM